MAAMLKDYSSSVQRSDNGNQSENNNLVILAFPTNDFQQESGSDEEIKKHVIDFLGPELYNNPNFVLFQKSSLQDNAVYELLRKHIPNRKVKHNFYKYIVGKDGLPTSFHTKKETLFEMEDEFSGLITGS